MAQHATHAEEQDILLGNAKAKPETDQDEIIKTENPESQDRRVVSIVTEREKEDPCAIIAKLLDILLGIASNVKMRLVRKAS